MRRLKAALAVLLCAAVSAPATAQVRAAASMAGTSVPRVALGAALTVPSLQSPVLFSAPVLAGPAVSAAPLVSAPSAVALAASPASAAAPAVASPLAAPLTALAPRRAPEAVPALEAARAPAAAARAERPGADTAESARAVSEKFWSGSSEASADAAVTAQTSAAGAPTLARPSAPARGATRLWGAAAVGAVAVPAAHGFAGFISHVSPFLEVGAVLAGTYAANRLVHALLKSFGTKKNLDRHQVAAIRLVTSVVLWTAGAVLAMKLGGASSQAMTTVFGAGGTILTLGLRDVLGNVIQGVNFLITRPYTVGQRVSIDEQDATVSDITLTTVLLKKDDGSEVKIRHSALASKPVIIYGAYQYPDSTKLHLTIPAKPKFQGAFGVVWKSLDLKFLFSAIAFAALLVAPSFLPVLAAGWAATVLHYALAGSIAWLTRRVDLALGAAIGVLAKQNGWRPETGVVTRLAVSAALWAFGGGAALRLIGVSWTTLGASIGLTTLGIGLASNNFFGSVVQGGEVLFSKPFKVGDKLKVGTFEGTVEDMTLYHVVIKLDEGRHVLVPYAVVRDATLVVTPGQNKQ
jgi:small-conductance mechanosensitive channel